MFWHCLSCESVMFCFKLQSAAAFIIETFLLYCNVFASCCFRGLDVELTFKLVMLVNYVHTGSTYLTLKKYDVQLCAPYFCCICRTVKIASVVLFPGINPNCIASIFTFSLILLLNTRSITFLHIPVTLLLHKIRIPLELHSIWKPVAEYYSSSHQGFSLELLSNWDVNHSYNLLQL